MTDVWQRVPFFYLQNPDLSFACSSRSSPLMWWWVEVWQAWSGHAHKKRHHPTLLHSGCRNGSADAKCLVCQRKTELAVWKHKLPKWPFLFSLNEYVSGWRGKIYMGWISHMNCQLDHVKIRSDGNQSFTVLCAVCEYDKVSPYSEEFIISTCNKWTCIE